MNQNKVRSDHNEFNLDLDLRQMTEHLIKTSLCAGVRCCPGSCVLHQRCWFEILNSESPLTINSAANMN